MKRAAILGHPRKLSDYNNLQLHPAFITQNILDSVNIFYVGVGSCKIPELFYRRKTIPVVAELKIPAIFLFTLTAGLSFNDWSTALQKSAAPSFWAKVKNNSFSPSHKRPPIARFYCTFYNIITFNMSKFDL